MVKKSPEYQDNKGESSIKYTGVRKRKWGKWVSEIRLPNSRERIWLGSYDSPEKAARAFDAAQYCLRGKSANFNFPDNPPDIAGGRSMTPAEIQAAAARFANLSSNDVVDDHRMIIDESSEHRTVEESLCYSPSLSDATTVQMDSFEMGGVENSFHEQLSLSTALGSGNYVSDFGYYCTGFDDFTAADFYTTTQQQQQQPDNFNHGCMDDTYDASLYQDSYLWNF
ncbi:ethylene-responsive transcription factor ERF017 [Beta vulgaris subsp. vulgaris]|uniref:ethylene-responsive transcription factor ERF017 n=1 Tax=Beta vulgaris subsp. vulgaris TaxID=3555 RepID=UPI0020374490|nr:ethylene-responsive transcription factor ERF017 [Beta vulgaris subsp. vulgaris]